MIVRLVVEDEQRSRILIPPGAASIPVRGVVMYVGGYHRPADGEPIDLDLSPGDEVMFFREHLTELRLDGENVGLIHESHVLLVTDPARVYNGIES